VTSGSSEVKSGQSGVGGLLTLNPANGDFGNVKVGVRQVITFTVTNPPANAPLSPTLSGPNANQFVMSGGTCVRWIRPSSTPVNPCTMQVLFIPTSTGAKAASLDVSGNVTASLTGTGVAN
jgi:hypothetical protein